MAIEEIIAIAPELAEPIASLTFIAQILGVIASIWLILWVINFIFNIRRAYLLRKMLERLEETNDKLDILLKKSK